MEEAHELNRLTLSSQDRSRGPNSCSNIWQSGCNVDIFEKQTADTSNKVALISRRGIMSYAQLNAKANQLGHYLVTIGVRPETVVGVSLERGIDYIVSMLAIWKAGGAYLPLDVSLPTERLHHMISDSRVCHIISTINVANEKNLMGTSEHCLLLDDRDHFSALNRAPDTNLLGRPSRSDLAYVIYTSGTSGKPKGVAITHYGIPNMALDQRQTQEITQADRVMVFSRFCFDASIRDIHGALLNGASLYIPEEEEVLPGRLVETLRDQGITYVILTPSVLRCCAIESLPDLRKLGIAGESADHGLIRKWGKGRLIINAYGPTEATVCCSKRFYTNGYIEDETPISVGSPILNTEIHIIDPSGNPTTPGEIGEIYIQGPGVSRRGYLNLSAYTAERFSDNIISSNRGYKTGDLGRLLPNGEVQCLGRKDGQVKLNGQRIELEEVEKVIRTNPFVQDTIVLIRGSSEAKTLTAFIVCTEQNLSSEEKRGLLASLERMLEQKLPHYSIPSKIVFIPEFPKSAANKIDAAALPEPTLTTDETRAEASNMELTATQAKVMKLLSEILKLPSDLKVSPESTYAELGGNSLLAQILLSRLNEAFGSNLQIASFYRQRQTLANLADLVSQAKSPQSHAFHPSLADEARLPHHISPRHLPLRPNLSQRSLHTLLTGATGYLGAHLLSELLSHTSMKITCIVRLSNTNAEDQCRVEKALKSWGLWRSAYSDRIEIVSGDLSKPFMGMPFDTYAHLACSVDTVWHCAAAVNFLQPYSYLKEANVGGTIEIIRFASSFERKRLCYFSTLAVFFGAADVTLGREISCETWAEKIPTGYAQSKWVAEQMVLEYQRRGGEAVIFRPGRLLGSAQLGQCPTDDMTVRLLSSFVETGIAPDIDWDLDFTPVNICAKVAIEISSRVSEGIFHIVNPQSIKLRQIIEQINKMGIRIREIPYQAWKQCVLHSTMLRPLFSLFHESVDTDGNTVFDLLLSNPCFRSSAFSTEQTASTLLGTNLWHFPIYTDLLRIYLATTLQKIVRPQMLTVDVTSIPSTIFDGAESPRPTALMQPQIESPTF